jgi:two-component system chemotaxis response regulator CheB
LAFGSRVIGIVLTGALNDGTSGAMVIRAHGGVILVQDPDTAMYPSMPNSLLRMIPEARVATTAEIPQIIAQLVAEPIPYVVPSAHPQDESTAREVRIAELDMAEVENDLRNGKPSVFGCPDCGGVLWEIDQKGLLRFRCRVGHAYTADHLRAEQRFVVETALWAALRALEERASLYRRPAGRPAASGLSALEVFEERAATAEKNSHTLRDFLVNVNATSAEEEEAPESDAA